MRSGFGKSSEPLACAMPDVPRISVVMPVYNAEKYLSDAISSILQQTFNDFELIVIDDGSNDRSPGIIEAFAKKDRRLVVHRQKNSGLIASLNRACSLARGTFIARMDADDVSLPYRFERQVDFLEKHPDIGLLGTWIQDIGPAGQPGPIWPLPTTPDSIRWFLMFGNCIAHPSIMARRELIQGLRYRNEARHVEDYDLWIRMSAVSRLANLPEVLLKYRVVGQSVSSRNLSEQQEQATRLRSRLRTDVLNSSDAGVEIVTKDLLLKLYSAFSRKYSLSSDDESAIVLDIFRRLYLSGEIGIAWRPLLHLLPKMVSWHVVGKAFRFGLFYAKNARHGFTTQRQEL